MNRYQCAAWLGCVIALGACLPAARAADDATEAVLKAAGLSKVGAYYLLDSEKPLVDLFKEEETGRRKMEAALAKRASVEKDIAGATATMEKLNSQNIAESETLETISKNSMGNYNHQVDKVNTIRANLREGEAYLKKCRANLTALPDPGDEYVMLAKKYTDAMVGTADEYDKISADDGVKGAIKTINLTAKPAVKLGPSVWFTQQIGPAKKMQASVATQTITFDSVGGVPQVPVTLNGNTQVEMVIDSGASIVLLTADVAAKIGLKLTASDPTMQLTSADGVVTKAHILTIKSVRLGNFTVENVPCAVQPTQVKASINLLGATFMQHFVYKMDLAAGSIKLTQMSTSATPDAKRPVAAGETKGN